MKESTLIEPLFFDTDCICAFLWVNKHTLLPALYPGRIVLPKPVYTEISKVVHLKTVVDTMISMQQLILEEILIGSEKYSLYYSLAIKPEPGCKLIGKGEAASIALAKVRSGILASNNLKDVMTYVQEYGLNHVTTGKIMMEALTQGLITEEHGNTIWQAMINKRRKLGANTFSEFLNNQK